MRGPQAIQTLARPSITYIHSIPTGRNLAGVALGQSPVDGVGQGVFPEVREKLLVDLESREVGGVGKSLDGEGLNDGGLIGCGVDELVVHDLDIGVVGGELDDLVGDGLGISEGWDVFANASESQSNGLGAGSAQLGTGLLADENKIGGLLVGSDMAAHEARQAGVNTTTETLVGAAHDVQSLLVLGIERFCLSRLENLLRGLAVLAGLVHGSLGTVQLGGGHDLHGLGDLLDVADRLQTALDLTQGSVGSGIWGGAIAAEQSGSGEHGHGETQSALAWHGLRIASCFMPHGGLRSKANPHNERCTMGR